MARTISTNVSGGLTLSNTADSPVYVAAGVTVGNAGGPALVDAAPFYWSLSNGASALIAGTSFGVSFNAAGTVANHGSITASYTAGYGFSYNSTTRVLSITSAALYLGGGGVSNSQTGVVSGVVGVALGGTGSVVNAGKITDPLATKGAAVALTAGGSVTNQTGGTIAGGNYGILSDGAVTVSNQFDATITGASRGVFVVNASGSVTNGGYIGGSVVAGVYLSVGGSVTNQSGASLYGGEAGVVIKNAAGSVTNQGVIEELDPFTSQTFAIGGVLLLAGGSVDNAGGVISGASYGVDIANASGSVTNSGSINSFRSGGGAGVILVAGGYLGNTGTVSSEGYGVLAVTGAATVSNSGQITSYGIGSGAGLALLHGGSVSNAANGTITGEFIGLQFGAFGSATAAPAATFINQGTVAASDGLGNGAAVWMHGPGVVINQANATIQGGVNGTIVGGPLDGLSSGPFGIVAYYQTTVINYGSIGSGTYNSTLFQGGSTVGPKQFAFQAASTLTAIANLIEMAPGASFGGVVKASDGTASATLELLSGASTGTIRSFGSVTVNGVYYEGYLGFAAVNIDNGARWQLSGTVAAGTTIDFAGSGALTFADPSLMQGTITGFAAGDSIGLGGVTVTGSSFAGGVLTLTEASGGPINLDLNGSFATGDFLVSNTSGIAEIGLQVACFAAGTTIRLAQGTLPVERLVPGMRVLTLRGEAAEIVWIGQREVDCRQHLAPATVWPVRIAAGAFAPGRPARDLWLSPDHAVFVEGVLIPVHCLINGETIRQISVPSVTYYHVELTEHDVILAEGLAVESYLEAGNRVNFSNAGGAVRLFADFSARVWETAGCAQLVTTGQVVHRVRQALARRSVVRTRPVPWARLNNRYTYY